VVIIVALALLAGWLAPRGVMEWRIPGPVVDKLSGALPFGGSNDWHLWYEDEYFEDCDNSGAIEGSLPILPPDCQDQYVRGPAFHTESECNRAAQILRDRTPEMEPEDALCINGPVRPLGHPS